jgi:hypothetical protein
MSIGFWAAVPDSDFIVNFITRSVTSLYPAALRTRSSCRRFERLVLASFHSDCAAKIFRYGSCRDGVKRTVESRPLTNDNNGEAIPG